MGVMGAIVNLNHPAHVVEWHFIQLSVANIVVIALMIVGVRVGDRAAVPGCGA